MKPKIFFSALFIFFVFIINAQNIGYVDTDLIMSKMPQYTEAQARLSAEVTKWQQSIDTQKNELEKETLALENEKVLLTENQIKEKEQQIAEKQTKLTDYINSKFGVDGELLKMKKSIAKPIQDKVWNAIATVSQAKKIGIMFDKGDKSMVMIYSDPKYDYTDAVITELGLNKPEKKN